VQLFHQPRTSQFNWIFSMDARASQFLLIEPPDRVIEAKSAPITVVVNFVQSLTNKSR
jgi:hypothetical protein